ncbi:cation:proton antiporter [Sphingomicrobium marinum]|uniref:cation:proton antiporter n=1 Tax=Sphingomicrobium marinum TaxID=1227950 RepID=UPI002240BE2D|nr:cation:proton antiporter [Sphingomicrobium marinum]
MPVSELFLLALLVIFFVPWLAWRILGDRVVPLVVVQIVGGILLGPGIAGAIAPEAHAALFTPDVLQLLTGIAWWAVMLFVFVAGLELDLKQAWTAKTDTAVTSGFALAVPFLLGTAAAWWLMADPRWLGPNGTPLQLSVGVGMACAVTALPILVLFLERLELLRRPLGQRVLRYASLDDIAVWGLLALVLLDTDRLGRQGLFLLGFIAAAVAARWLFARLGGRDRWPLSLGWLILVALAADWSGLHFMVGAFLAGAVLEAKWFGHKKVDALRDRVLLLLMPVFFLSTGLRTSWEMGGWDVVLVAAGLLVAAVAGKLIGVGIAGRLLGWAKGDARLVGWLLQTKALIMIIFANILLDRGVISSTAFTALLLMAVASTVLTMPMARRVLAKL